jgi:gentisate 1,2-dioxygenase
MPTMRCEMLRVPASAVTPCARQTGARVGCVLHGTGHITISGQDFPLAPGDIIAIPSWHAASLHAAEQLDVFFTSDAPVLAALGLHRTQQDGAEQ